MHTCSSYADRIRARLYSYLNLFRWVNFLYPLARSCIWCIARLQDVLALFLSLFVYCLFYQCTMAYPFRLKSDKFCLCKHDALSTIVHPTFFLGLLLIGFFIFGAASFLITVFIWFPPVVRYALFFLLAAGACSWLLQSNP